MTSLSTSSSTECGRGRKRKERDFEALVMNTKKPRFDRALDTEMARYLTSLDGE